MVKLVGIHLAVSLRLMRLTYMSVLERTKRSEEWQGGVETLDRE